MHDDNGSVIFVEHKVVLSLCLIGTSFALGLSGGITGPSFVHLLQILHTDTQGLGLTAIGENLGFIFGSILCGFIFHKLNKDLQVACAYFWMAVNLGVAPWVGNVYVYYVIFFLFNLSCGYLDVCLQVYILKIWLNHKHKDAYNQALHTLWMVGMFVCPFIVFPFLSELHIKETGMEYDSCKTYLNIHTSLGSTNSTTTINMTAKTNAIIPQSNLNYSVNSNECDTVNNIALNSTVINSSLLQTEYIDEDLSNINVRYAFLTVALVDIISGIVVTLAYVMNKKTTEETYLIKSKSSETITEQDEMSTFNKSESPHISTNGISGNSGTTSKAHNRIYMLLFYTLISTHVGLGQAPMYIVNTYLSAFVIKGLSWQVTLGPLITSVFRGMLSLGGIIAIPLSVILTPTKMLVLSTTLALIGFILMVFLSNVSVIMWISVILAGLGIAPLYASMFLLGSDYLEVTAKYGMLLVSISAIASMAGSSLTGVLFQHFSHMWMVYVSLGSIVLSGLVFCCILLTAKLYTDSTRGNAVGDDIPFKTHCHDYNSIK